MPRDDCNIFWVHCPVLLRRSIVTVPRNREDIQCLCARLYHTRLDRNKISSVVPFNRIIIYRISKYAKRLCIASNDYYRSCESKEEDFLYPEKEFNSWPSIFLNACYLIGSPPKIEKKSLEQWNSPYLTTKRICFIL